jgi:hypothetical protein
MHSWRARPARARRSSCTRSGGLTTWIPSGEVSRSRRVAISLAGPAAGIALGLVFVAADRAGVGTDGGLAGTAIYLGIRVNILYGLFNLLPILPLDGGQTLRDLLPGDAPRREKTAAIVSIVVGAAAIVAALRFDEPFAAIFVAMFVFSNVASLRQGNRPARQRTGPAGGVHEAMALYGEGKLEEAAAVARQAAETADRIGDHETVVKALAGGRDGPVSTRETPPRQSSCFWISRPGRSIRCWKAGCCSVPASRHSASSGSRPRSPRGRGEQTAYHLAAGLIQTGGHQRLLRLVADETVPTSVLLFAAQASLDSAAPDVAGRIAELAGRRSGPELGQAAFLAARAWTRAGQRDRALLALEAAVAVDHRYAQAAGETGDLSLLRGPEFDRIVGAVR